MAKARKKDKDAVKWKKKKWLPIFATKVFNNSFLGETHIMEPAKVIGRTLKVNLMNLTGEVRNQNVNIRFRVTSMGDNRAQAEPIGYILSPAFIKRVVRRRHSRVDSSFLVETKDGKKLRLKPLMITRSCANNSTTTALRKGAQSLLSEIASTSPYSEFVNRLVTYKIQREAKKRLTKIYPLKSFEVMKMELIERKEDSQIVK